MNEQIKELALHSGATFNVIAQGRHDGVLFTETELERFVQLIIQRCKYNILDTANKFPKDDVTWVSAMTYAADILK